jgi:hypothetical protein
LCEPPLLVLCLLHVWIHILSPMQWHDLFLILAINTKDVILHHIWSISITIRLQAYHIEYIIAFPLLFSFDPCTFKIHTEYLFLFFVKHNSKYILHYFFVSCRKEKSNTENYRSESMRVEIERRKQNSRLSQLFFFFLTFLSWEFFKSKASSTFWFGQGHQVIYSAFF